VLHQGVPQTFVSSLPTLIRLSRKANSLRKVLGCRAAPALHQPGGSVADIPDLDWSHCPIDLIDSPQMVAVRNLSRLANISPLAGWPDKFAPWVVAGLMLLRESEA